MADAAVATPPTEEEKARKRAELQRAELDRETARQTLEKSRLELIKAAIPAPTAIDNRKISVSGEPIQVRIAAWRAIEHAAAEIARQVAAVLDSGRVLVLVDEDAAASFAQYAIVVAELERAAEAAEAMLAGAGEAAPQVLGSAPLSGLLAAVAALGNFAEAVKPVTAVSAVNVDARSDAVLGIVAGQLLRLPSEKVFGVRLPRQSAPPPADSKLLKLLARLAAATAASALAPDPEQKFAGAMARLLRLEAAAGHGDAAFLFVESLAAGGNIVLTNRWFLPAKLSYCGGAVLRYTLTDREGRTLASGMAQQGGDYADASP